MRKIIRLVIGIYAVALLAIGGWQIYSYCRDTFASNEINEELAELAVVKQTEPETTPEEDTSDEPETAAPTEPLERAPISVDFEALEEQSEDIVAWLYLDDSIINYPVAQAEDNAYYLRRLLDGTPNNTGTLFVDYRNSADFSDPNTVIYGHNMKNDTAFGTLELYKEQEYYDAHPVMWLLTPDAAFKLELVAGYVTHSDSQIYVPGLTAKQQLVLVEEAVGKSTFVSDVAVDEDDRFVTLSTCSYEYTDARYVLIGRLTPAAQADSEQNRTGTQP